MVSKIAALVLCLACWLGGSAPGLASVRPRATEGARTSFIVRYRDRGDADGALAKLGYTVLEGGDTNALAAARRDRRVLSVQPNHVRRAAALPDDPWFDWNQDGQDELVEARFPLAWGVTKGADDIDIAILDTGFQLDHPDLVARMVPGIDVVDGDNTPTVKPPNAYVTAHGTMVAALAAADTDNGIGIAGAAWNARIMPIRVLDDLGIGTDADIATGIVWAVDHGAEIINLSLAGPSTGELLGDAVAYALAENVVVIAAAGNNASVEPHYPAAYDGVVAVSTDWSYWGAVANRGPWIDLVAPAHDFTSSPPDTSFHPQFLATGSTSFATPIVSGAAALVRAQHPDWTPAQIARRLTTTAADRGPRGFDDVYGYGLLDAYAAVGGRTANSPPPPQGDDNEPNDVPARATVLTLGDEIDATISSSDDDEWYAVDVPGAGRLVMSLAGYADGSDLYATAYTPDRKRIGRGFALPHVCCPQPREFVVPIASAGRYLVHLRGDPVDAVAPLPYSVRATWSPERVTGYIGAELFPRGTDPYAGAGAPALRAVDAADVTGDGRDDVIALGTEGSAQHTNGVLMVFAQLDDGTIGPPVRYPVDVDPQVTLSVHAGDMDADGDLDVVASTGDSVGIFTQGSGSSLPLRGAFGSAGPRVEQGERLERLHAYFLEGCPDEVKPALDGASHPCAADSRRMRGPRGRRPGSPPSSTPRALWSSSHRPSSSTRPTFAVPRRRLPKRAPSPSPPLGSSSSARRQAIPGSSSSPRCWQPRRSSTSWSGSTSSPRSRSGDAPPEVSTCILSLGGAAEPSRRVRAEAKAVLRGRSRLSLLGGSNLRSSRPVLVPAHQHDPLGAQHRAGRRAPRTARPRRRRSPRRSTPLFDPGEAPRRAARWPSRPTASAAPAAARRRRRPGRPGRRPACRRPAAPAPPRPARRQSRGRRSRRRCRSGVCIAVPGRPGRCCPTRANGATTRSPGAHRARPSAPTSVDLRR